MKTDLDFGDRSEKIIKGMYIVAAIENFGDLILNLKKSYDNLKNEDKDIILIKKLIIKYSKYFYRIFKVLIKSGNNKLLNKAKYIYEKVIPFRESYDLEKAKELNIFEIIYYDNENIKDYINKISNIIINEINNSFINLKIDLI